MRAQQVLSSCCRPAPSRCPYLACPPGVRGRWAWTAALGPLNSQPVHGIRRSSPAVSQKSGGREGARVSTEDGKDPPFLQPWPRAAGDPQEGQAALGVGGRLGAHCSPEFQLQVSLSPEITSHAHDAWNSTCSELNSSSASQQENPFSSCAPCLSSICHPRKKLGDHHL